MKYLFIQSKPSGYKKFVTYVFAIEDYRRLNRLYYKLRTLCLRGLVDGGFYVVGEIPREIFDEWEWGVLEYLENFRLANMVILNSWEYELMKVINYLGLRKELKKIVKNRF